MAVSNGLGSPLCDNSRDEDLEIRRRDITGRDACPRLLLPTVLMSSTITTTPTTSATRSASSSLSPSLSNPCINGEVYVELLSCQEGGLSGTSRQTVAMPRRCEGCVDVVRHTCASLRRRSLHL